MIYTCLAASPELNMFGFTRVVAVEVTREEIAAFKSPVDASAFCDRMNGVVNTGEPKVIDEKIALGQKADIKK